MTRVPILILLMSMLISVSGCGDKIIYPVKLDKPANTFGLSEKRWGGHISEVIVWNREREVLWKLKPTRKMPVKGFAVTVGEIPEGFVQTVPLPPEKFTPIAGEVYWLGVNGSFDPRAWPIEIEWTAE